MLWRPSVRLAEGSDRTLGVLEVVLKESPSCLPHSKPPRPIESSGFSPSVSSGRPARLSQSPPREVRAACETACLPPSYIGQTGGGTDVFAESEHSRSRDCSLISTASERSRVARGRGSARCHRSDGGEYPTAASQLAEETDQRPAPGARRNGDLQPLRIEPEIEVVLKKGREPQRRQPRARRDRVRRGNRYTLAQIQPKRRPALGRMLSTWNVRVQPDRRLPAGDAPPFDRDAVVIGQ
jgi:hypothetical protein